VANLATIAKGNYCCHHALATIAKGMVANLATIAKNISVWEGILLGARKKFALKITTCPENNFFSLM